MRVCVHLYEYVLDYYIRIVGVYVLYVNLQIIVTYFIIFIIRKEIIII